MSEAVTGSGIIEIAASDAAAPAEAISLIKVRVCPECSDDFSPPSKGPGQHKRFCKDACRTAWANREKAQGAVVVTMLKIWREHRGSGEVGREAFAELCSIADVLISDDRAAGRKSFKSRELDPFVRDLLRDRYIDRRR